MGHIEAAEICASPFLSRGSVHAAGPRLLACFRAQLAAVGGALVARGCHDLSATSGAEHLAGRSWRGLEQRLGEDEPAAVRPGRSGIASGFAGEGGAGAGAPHADLHDKT